VTEYVLWVYVALAYCTFRELMFCECRTCQNTIPADFSCHTVYSTVYENTTFELEQCNTALFYSNFCTVTLGLNLPIVRLPPPT
jgi:hypothetical protein